MRQVAFSVVQSPFLASSRILVLFDSASKGPAALFGWLKKLLTSSIVFQLRNNSKSGIDYQLIGNRVGMIRT